MSRIGGLIEKAYDYQSFSETDLQAVPGKLMPTGEQCIKKVDGIPGEESLFIFLPTLGF